MLIMIVPVIELMPPPARAPAGPPPPAWAAQRSEARDGLPGAPRLGSVVADYAPLDQPVRTVRGVVHLVVVRQAERAQVDQEVMLVRHRHPDLGHLGV